MTVNVGAPVLHSGPVASPPPSAGQGIANAVDSIRQAQQQAALRKQQFQQLVQGAHHFLAQCDQTIAEIEATIALELLPAMSPVRQRYVRALEVRHRVIQQLPNLRSVEEASTLYEHVRWAVSELHATRHALSTQ